MRQFISPVRFISGSRYRPRVGHQCRTLSSST
nr:MAG TPA: hypothetical protein [Caudoviricetes sp.]